MLRSWQRWIIASTTNKFPTASRLGDFVTTNSTITILLGSPHVLPPEPFLTHLFPFTTIASTPQQFTDSDAVMKNPFYTLEMPINVGGFDERVGGIIAQTVG